MKVAIIGRSEYLYDTAKLLVNNGHEIKLIITAKAAPEYTVNDVDFKNLADSLGARYIYTTQISDSEVVSQIKNLGPLDIGVSFNYISIISQEVINLFQYGILNAHGGDLPRYKGNACQAWAILNGEEKIGLCIHKMVGGVLDEGDIIERLYYPLNLNSKITECLGWMHQNIPVLFNSALQKLAEMPDYCLERVSDFKSKSLRCFPRMPQDGRIDWNKKAIEILRLINASNKPYYGAYCYFNNEEIRIWDAELVEFQGDFLAMTGQVCEIDKINNYVVVSCIDGMLKINHVHFQGQDQFPTAFIKSIRSRLT